MSAPHRSMRRKDREMDRAEAEDLLREADFGFLASVDAEGQPYCVPLNHTFEDGYIIFHSAMEGAKLDNIRNNPKVSYAVCTQHELQPEHITTKYKSAIAFGTAEIVEDPATKRILLTSLLKRLAPQQGFICGEEIISKTCVVRIKADVVTGKKRE